MIQSTKIIGLFFFLALFVASSCNRSEKKEEEQAIEDEIILQQYILDNNLNTMTLEVGSYHKIHYTTQIQGSGDNPTINSTVTVHYRGTLLDGTEFDSSLGGDPITFGLNQVIRGWGEGIPLYKRGGKGILLIPSGLAYGPNGNSPIGPNEALRFDIELFDFE